jgi:hypothetical protein
VPSPPLAHEKWFVDDPGSFDADWGFALEAPSLALIGAVVLAALLAGPVAMLEAIDLSGDAFIRMAGAIELLFGLLLISGRLPQVAVIVAGIPFNATLFFLGRTELIGHLPVYGVMLALLVYGSSRRYADVVPAWPWPWRRRLSERVPARA